MDENLLAFIDEALTLIPTELETFRASLAAIRESTKYSAPELIPMRVKHAAISLESHCGGEILDGSPEWQRELLKSWRKHIINNFAKEVSA